MFIHFRENRTNEFTVETYESTTENGTPVNKKIYYKNKKW